VNWIYTVAPALTPWLVMHQGSLDDAAAYLARSRGRAELVVKASADGFTRALDDAECAQLDALARAYR
jgi:hypothetical protein